ncbi:hypothetical protein HZB02_02905 [Candidatus Woesearchaeota archaeon]|nr:hypothetical protein [Candidatus Woesearchaeota archaeon]
MPRKQYPLFFLLIMLVALLTNGCIQQIPQQQLMNATLNTPFQLKANQTAVIESENMHLTFLQVLGDSRCPSDVLCVWEGQATVTIIVQKDNQNLDNINLTSRAGRRHEDLARKNFAEYTVTLISVDPYPKSVQQINPQEYTITLVVDKQS